MATGVAGEAAPGTRLWEFQTGDWVESSPALGTDGTVYIGSWDKKIYALDGVTGSKRWEFVTGDAVRSSPALAQDGTVYVGSGDDKLYALDGTTGAKRWEFKTGGDVVAGPAVGADGTVFVGSADKRLYALDGGSGARRWAVDLGGRIEAAPAIGPDGTVYVGSGDGRVYALGGQDGTLRWEFLTGGAVRASSPGLGPDGTVYVGSGEYPPDTVAGKLYALDGGTGSLRWVFTASNWVSSSPIIGPDGLLVVGSDDHKVYALDAGTGARRWEFKTGAVVRGSSAAIASDGTLYIGSHDGKLYALDAATGDVRWQFTAGRSVSASPAITPDGTVVVASEDGKVYALAGTTGLADASWPMLGRDQRRSSSGQFSGPPRIVSVPKSVEAAPGSTATLGVVAGGTMPLAYRWLKDGEALEDTSQVSGTGLATLTIRGVQSDDVGEYSVEVTNAEGSIVTPTAAVNLRAPAPGEMVWSFQTGGAVVSSPAIGPDGTIYFGSTDAKVYALDPTVGKKRWEFPTGGAILSAPCVASNGTVYVGSMAYRLYALRGDTGTLQWSYRDPDIWTALDELAVSSDGMLYVSSGWEMLAINGQDGLIQWSALIGASVDYAPAIGVDRGIYFGADGGKVHALDGVTGAKRWEFIAGKGISTPPALGADGTVYVGARDNRLYALDGMTGAKRWEYSTADYISSSATIGADGGVYFATGNNRMHAVDAATGTKRWEVVMPDYVTSAAAIGSDGTVYVGSRDGRLYALDGATGERLWDYHTGGAISSPVIGSDGKVYFGSEDGRVYALYCGGTLATAPWPALGGDARHSGARDFAGPPTIVAQPGSVDAPQGGTARLAVLAGGTSPLSYQWFKDGVVLENGTRVDGAQTSVVVIRGLSPEDRGEYSVRVSNALETALSSAATVTMRAALAGELLWSFETGGAITASPSVASGGTVYVGSHDKRLYALRGDTGTKLWEFTTGGRVWAPPVVGPDGVVYVGGEDALVHALDGASGTKRWEFVSEAPSISAVALGKLATLYVAAGSRVYGVEASTGIKRWEFALNTARDSWLAVGVDETVYVSAPDGTAYALAGDSGAKLWEYKVSNAQSASPPTVGWDGTVYLGLGTALCALDERSGVQRGRVWLEGEVTTSPTIAPGGLLIVGTSGKVYGVDPVTGTSAWESAIGGSYQSSAAVGADGTLYFGCLDRKLYALDGSTGTRRWEFATGGQIRSSPALDSGGTLYFGSDDKRLYAVYVGSVPADTAWPMLGQNLQRTHHATMPPLVLPAIVSHPQAQQVRQGDWAEFTVTTTGTAPLAYQWRFNGGAIEGATEPVLSLANVAVEQAGAYDVVVTNTVGAVTSVVAQLTVLVPPTITTQPVDREVKPGETASFEVEASGTTPLAYQWRFNDEPLAGETARSRTLVLTEVTPSQDGPYDVVVTNIVGSVTSLVARLFVLVPPAITTQPADQEVAPGDTATFTVVATGSPPLGYLWTFQGAPIVDATTASLVLTGVTEAHEGSYSVTVTNRAGSVASHPARLVVRPVPPPTLTVSRLADGRVLIQWDDDSVLQSVEALGAEWQELAAARSPYTVSPSDVRRFYRLRGR